MAISVGSMRVCLHPPQVSHGTPVMAGRCPDGWPWLEPGPILVIFYNWVWMRRVPARWEGLWGGKSPPNIIKDGKPREKQPWGKRKRNDKQLEFYANELPIYANDDISGGTGEAPAPRGCRSRRDDRKSNGRGSTGLPHGRPREGKG